MENIWMAIKATTDGFFGFWTMLSAGMPIAIGLMLASCILATFFANWRDWPFSGIQLVKALSTSTFVCLAFAAANVLLSAPATQSAAEMKDLYVGTTLFAGILTAFWAGSIVGIIVGFVANRRRAGVTQ